MYVCTALYRTQLPLTENSFNGCQGHPPLCLPPRTAQRLPDRIQTMFGRAVFIQLTNPQGEVSLRIEFATLPPKNHDLFVKQERKGNWKDKENAATG
jgi:hypothetical protein